MNLLVYLVYERDKTFDMQSIKALKSLLGGFVRNVWVYQCSCTNDLRLRVLYFRDFVYHSLSCYSPLLLMEIQEMYMLLIVPAYLGK